MKAILLTLIPASVLFNFTSTGQTIFQAPAVADHRQSEACDPPFLVSGLFDPTLPNDPNPAIFDAEIRSEIMSDGFEGKDKEYGDVNGDGLIDILYTTNVNQLWYIPNTGTATHPEYFFDSRIFTGFTGAFSFKFTDWYADGINDLVVLESVVGSPTVITLYLDIASQLGFPAPIATLIDGADVPISPNHIIEIGDIDGDQFPDILVSGQGAINGTALFLNLGMGWSFPPTFGLAASQTYDFPMIPETGGSSPVPELFDADCDGDLDLFISDPLVSGASGHVDYYENTGQGSPFLYFTKHSPKLYGLYDIPLPNTDLNCDYIITRFVDFFGDGFPEVIAHNPCDGGIFYYSNSHPCQASFEIFGNEFCNEYQFINTSIGAGQATYLWNFDDPASGINNASTFFEPSHTFSACGLYNVCLTISGDGCESVFCLVVNVTDPVPPVALCLGIGMILDSNCMGTIQPGFIDGGSSDNCLLTSLSVSPNTLTQCGIFPVVLTATDWCGNTGTCTTNVEVIGFEPTTITCPSNKTLSSTSPNCTSVVNGLKWTGLTASCTGVSITYSVTGASNYSGAGDASGLIFNQGTSTVTYTVRDGCGNIQTCSFDVTLHCICECPNNLLKNSGFYEGAIPGNLNNMGQSDHWDFGTRTPQIINTDSCCDDFAIQMWGILQNTNFYSYTGEAIYQQGLSFVAGKHYKISFCGRYLPGQTIANNVNFGFTASNGWVNPYVPCGNCDDIGNSPQIFSSTWTTYTLPIWTPTQNWNRLNIRVYSSQGIQTWGRIDNICVEEVPYNCCTDQVRFEENMENAVNITVDEITEEIVFSIGDLPGCDSIAYIDWGNGEITVGPFGGNTERRNRILDHLLARVQYKVQEFDHADTTHPVCLEAILSDSVEATLSSTKYLMRQKKCGKIGEQQKKIEWSSRIACIDRGGRSEVSSSRYHLEAAVLKPVVYNDPVVKITHTRGFTVVATQAGEVIQLFPNDNISAKIQTLYPAPDGYEWYGLQSNLLTPTTSSEIDSLPFNISFTFHDVPDGSEDSTGAIWISDDKDDLYGEYIIDGFAYFDTARTTYSTEYGLRFKIECKYYTAQTPPPPHFVSSWTITFRSLDSGGRGTSSSPYHLETAILKAIALSAPEIILTDTFGNPLFTEVGEEIFLTPDSGVTAKIQRLYSAPAGYEWYGLRSNQLTPTSSETEDSMDIKITFQWIDPPEGTLDSTGAFWISDDKDDMYGEFITDWFTLLGASVPDTTTSVNPEPIENLIKLYPNPTNGKLTIDWSNMMLENVSISIVDCYGVLQSTSLTNQYSSQRTLNVNQLPAGIFFIKIISGNKLVKILKFVKI